MIIYIIIPTSTDQGTFHLPCTINLCTKRECPLMNALRMSGTKTIVALHDSLKKLMPLFTR